MNGIIIFRVFRYRISSNSSIRVFLAGEQMDGAARIPSKTKDTDATMSDDDRPIVVKKEDKFVLQSPYWIDNVVVRALTTIGCTLRNIGQKQNSRDYHDTFVKRAKWVNSLNENTYKNPLTENQQNDIKKWVTTSKYTSADIQKILIQRQMK